MQPSTTEKELARTVDALKSALARGSLKRHPAADVIGLVGREVLASWGSAMRR